MPNLNVGLGLALGGIGTTWALTLEAGVMCFIEEGTPDTGCSSLTRVINCGTGGVYQDCAQCSTGYTRTANTLETSLETYTYYTCTRSAVSVTCPTSCTSTSWTSAGTGKQVRCVKNITSALCQYRCAANYYGNGITCTACPRYNGVSGTCAAGSTSCSACCISSGTSFSFSDTAGSGTAKTTQTCCCTE